MFQLAETIIPVILFIFFQILPIFYTLYYGYQLMVEASRKEETRSLNIGFFVVVSASIFACFYSPLFLIISILVTEHMVAYRYCSGYHIFVQRKATEMDLKRQLGADFSDVIDWLLFLHEEKGNGETFWQELWGLCNEGLQNLPAFRYAAQVWQEPNFVAAYQKVKQLSLLERARFLQTKEGDFFFQLLLTSRNQFVERYNTYHLLDEATKRNEQLKQEKNKRKRQGRQTGYTPFL